MKSNVPLPIAKFALVEAQVDMVVAMVEATVDTVVEVNTMDIEAKEVQVDIVKVRVSPKEESKEYVIINLNFDIEYQMKIRVYIFRRRQEMPFSPKPILSKSPKTIL